MHIMVELSGVGYYGVCSLVRDEILPLLVDAITARVEKTGEAKWENPQLERSRATGIKAELTGSLRILKNTVPGYTRLGWQPRVLAEAMLSHHLLHTSLVPLPHSFKEPLFPLGLELDVGRGSRGWYVHANFGEEIWNRMESYAFRAAIPHMNNEVRSWWEDQFGSLHFGQCITFGEGKDGKLLQVTQPSGQGGLWIAGNRGESVGSNFQLHDHNTDSYDQAFAHIYSLCVILQHCRRLDRALASS